MTTEKDGPGLPMRPEEFELLAHKWARLPEGEKAYFTDNMSRAQRRRFERTLAEVQDGKKSFAGKMTTREDVVTIVALFMERKVLPLAAEVDKLRAEVDYLRLPWWRKARVTWNVWRVLAVKWLASKGVTFSRVETDGQEGTEAEAVLAPDNGADGVGTAKAPDGEGGSSGFTAPAPAVPSMIEVVPR